MYTHIGGKGRCRTRGESEDHTSKKACKGSTLALKPRAEKKKKKNLYTKAELEKTDSQELFSASANEDFTQEDEITDSQLIESTKYMNLNDTVHSTSDIASAAKVLVTTELSQGTQCTASEALAFLENTEQLPSEDFQPRQESEVDPMTTRSENDLLGKESVMSDVDDEIAAKLLGEGAQTAVTNKDDSSSSGDSADYDQQVFHDDYYEDDNNEQTYPPDDGDDNPPISEGNNIQNEQTKMEPLPKFGLVIGKKAPSTPMIHKTLTVMHITTAIHPPGTNAAMQEVMKSRIPRASLGSSSSQGDINTPIVDRNIEKVMESHLNAGSGNAIPSPTAQQMRQKPAVSEQARSVQESTLQVPATPTHIPLTGGSLISSGVLRAKDPNVQEGASAQEVKKKPIGSESTTTEEQQSTSQPTTREHELSDNQQLQPPGNVLDIEGDPFFSGANVFHSFHACNIDVEIGITCGLVSCNK